MGPVGPTHYPFTSTTTHFVRIFPIRTFFLILLSLSRFTIPIRSAYLNTAVESPAALRTGLSNTAPMPTTYCLSPSGAALWACACPAFPFRARCEVPALAGRQKTSCHRSGTRVPRQEAYSGYEKALPLTAGIGNSPGAREGFGCFTNAARRSRNRARPFIVLPAGTGADTLRWRAR